MQWKHKIILQILIINCVQQMLISAQEFFTTFGSQHGNTPEIDDYYEEEPYRTKSSRLPFPDLGFQAGPINFNFSLRNGNGHGRGNGRGNGRGKGNDRNHSHEDVEDETPRGRSIGRGRGRGRGQNRDRKEEQGPCGPGNQFCHGEDFVKELGLNWRGSRIHNGTGIFVPDKTAPDGKRFISIGIELSNKNFYTCTTPANQTGHCRHLEYCVLDEFKSNFLRFLEYWCDIPNQNYVGVCCPDSVEEGRSRQPGNTFPGFPTAPPRRTTPRSRGGGVPPPRELGGSPRRTSGCGISERDGRESRIAGGRISDPRAWPWMVALLKKNEATDHRAGQYCGGVLISEFSVLTAAHCVDNLLPSTLSVRVGEYDFSRHNGTSGPNDIDVAEIFIHENYNRYYPPFFALISRRYSYKNDIAVIKLRSSAFYEPRIINICLPSSEDADLSLEGVHGIVTGFGTIYYGGPASDQLMEITVPIWSQEDCKAAYTQPIEDTNLCAGVRTGSRDSCQGDSGGPLQAQLRGRWTCVGVVSWGIRCSEPGYPGVYSRVSSYLNWITTKMRM